MIVYHAQRCSFVLCESIMHDFLEQTRPQYRYYALKQMRMTAIRTASQERSNHGVESALTNNVDDDDEEEDMYRMRLVSTARARG